MLECPALRGLGGGGIGPPPAFELIAFAVAFGSALGVDEDVMVLGTEEGVDKGLFLCIIKHTSIFLARKSGAEELTVIFAFRFPFFVSSFNVIGVKYFPSAKNVDTASSGFDDFPNTPGYFLNTALPPSRKRPDAISRTLLWASLNWVESAVSRASLDPWKVDLFLLAAPSLRRPEASWVGC